MYIINMAVKKIIYLYILSTIKLYTEEMFYREIKYKSLIFTICLLCLYLIQYFNIWNY